MNVKELRSKSETELRELLTSQREKLQSFRFDLTGGKVKHIHALREARKTIARILTTLREDQSTEEE